MVQQYNLRSCKIHTSIFYYPYFTIGAGKNCFVSPACHLSRAVCTPPHNRDCRCYPLIRRSANDHPRGRVAGAVQGSGARVVAVWTGSGTIRRLRVAQGQSTQAKRERKTVEAMSCSLCRATLFK